jgi:cation-transporting ATPase 13A3/4/5
MDEDGRRSPDPGQDHGHHGRGHRGSNGNARHSLYRMSSNQSRSSIFEDVEMAHEEVNDESRAWIDAHYI